MVSIVNGLREPILYSFAREKPPLYKIHNQPRVKFLKKINKSVLSHITFYLEDDNHKPVDFNIETIGFTCELKKIYVSYLCTYHYMSVYTRGIHTNKFVFLSQAILLIYIQLYGYLYVSLQVYDF